MTDLHDVALRNAIRDTPFDSALRRVFADMLEEGNNDAGAAEQRAFADLLDHPLNADLPARVQAAVERANGQVRTRKIDQDDGALCFYWAIAAVVEKANGRMGTRKIDQLDGALCCYWAFSQHRKGGMPAEFIDGGGIANSYNYAATTALFLAVLRADGKLCVDGGPAAARKDGGSPANVWRELVEWKEGDALRERLAVWASTR